MTKTEDVIGKYKEDLIMSYTIEDFMNMTNDELLSLWNDGIYLRPDEMNDYWRVRESRNMEGDI